MNDDVGHKGMGAEEEPTDSMPLDQRLEEASASLESARSMLSLRKTVGRNLRVAVRCLLEAQDKIDVEGPSPAARLDLLEAIRLIGIVERGIKGDLEPEFATDPVSASVAAVDDDPRNRRNFQRLPANIQIQLEPEHRARRADLITLPLDGTAVNVSRGGILAKIDQGILRHGRYLIRFLEANGAIEPAVTWGAVRRSRARDRGWEVGIEFDDPLEKLN